MDWALFENSLIGKLESQYVLQDWIFHYNELLKKNSLLHQELKLAQQFSGNNTQLVRDDGKLLQVTEELSEAYKKQNELKEEQSSLHEQIDSLSGILEAHNQRIKTLESDLAEKDVLIQKQSEELECCSRSNAELTAEIVDLKGQIDTLENTNRKLEADNDELLSRWMEKMALEAEAMNKAFEHEKMEMEEKKKVIEARQSVTAPLPASGNAVANCFGLLPKVPSVTIPTAHSQRINDVKFGSKGSKVISCGGDSLAKVWDSRTGMQLAELRGSKELTVAVLLCGDQYALTGGVDKSCCVWNLATARTVHKLTGHTGKIMSACPIPGGGEFRSTRVVTASSDRTVRVWSLNKGYVDKTLMVESVANSVAVSPRGILASGHQNGCVRLWDVHQGVKIADVELSSSTIPGQSSPLTGVSFGRDGTLVALARNNALYEIDTRMYKIVSIFRDPDFKVATNWSRLACSSDCQQVVGGGMNGKLFVWGLGASKNSAAFVGTSGKHHIVSVDWSPVTPQLVSCDTAHTIAFWNA